MLKISANPQSAPLSAEFAKGRFFALSAPYPLKAVRALALRAQGLDAPTPRGFRAGADEVYDAVRRVGWTQIDTLQVVNRAQYVTLWSRLGDYDPETLDRLAFDGGADSPDNGRRLFEYWAHAACLIPLAEYRHFMPMMRRRRGGRGGWHRKWASDPDNRRLLQTVLEEIRANGAGKPADFRTEKKKPGAWWNWDSAQDSAGASVRRRRSRHIQPRQLPAGLRRARAGSAALGGYGGAERG